MKKLNVIGIGPGRETMLTLEARQAMEAADVLWCADRTGDLVPEEKRRSLTPFQAAMEQMESAFAQDKEAAVLLSGDTGLYSMLPMLKKRFGEEKLNVLCGISSVQLLCARLKIAWQDTAIISAHGRRLSSSALCHNVRTHPKTIVLLDEERDPNWVKTVLRNEEMDSLELIVGERLSYEEESIAPYEKRKYDPLSLALIINDAPVSGLPAIGLRDEDFIRAKTPMTKREVRMQVISELKLQQDAVVWDIGAGTGSVSIECARQCPLGEVYAIERDEEALKLIEGNRKQFHTQNLNIIAGEAPQALKGLSAPTHVFLGGTGGEAAEIVKLIEDFHTPVRLCATAVTLESTQLFAQLLDGYEGFCAYQLSVSRLEKLGRYRMPKAQNPVYIFSCTVGGNV